MRFYGRYQPGDYQKKLSRLYKRHFSNQDKKTKEERDEQGRKKGKLSGED